MQLLCVSVALVRLWLYMINELVMYSCGSLECEWETAAVPADLYGGGSIPALAS